MARKKSPTLTDAEIRLMRIVWEKQPCTIADIVDGLPPDQPLAYSTVLTTMRILEEKGYVEHEQEGRAYVYEAVIDPKEVRKDALDYVMDRFFDNSPELLMANLLEDEDVSSEHLKQLRSLLDEHGKDEEDRS